MAVADIAQQITGVEPGIPLFKDIAQNLGFGRLFAGVAGKRVGFGYFTQQQSGFADFDLLHEPVFIPDGGVLIDVVFHDCIGETASADRAVKVQQVDKIQVGFGGTVNFVNFGNAEPVFEILPDIRAQAVADDFFQGIVTVIRPGWLVDQVAAQLPDIAPGGGIVFADITPEVADAEFAPDGDGGPVCKDCRPAQRQGVGVEKGQGHIHGVGRC